MRRKLLFYCFLLLCCKAGAQQDIQFSQYIFNNLSINPAYAGYRGDLHFNTTGRAQWVGFPGAPRTLTASLDGLVNGRDGRMGVGGQVMVDKLGPEDALSLYGFYAYRIPLDNEDSRRLCVGIGAGFTQYSVDGTALQYVEANDPNIPVGKVSTLVPDARFGVYYYTPRFFIGASMMDMFSLNMDRKIYYSKITGVTVANIRKSAHLYLSAGYLFDLSDNVKMKPSVMIKEDFKGPTNMDATLFFLLAERLWVGGSYRTGIKIWNKSNLQANLMQRDAASLVVEYFATERLRIGYSYDFTTSGLSSYQTGSHEISISLTFPNKRNSERIMAPRYF